MTVDSPVPPAAAAAEPRGLPPLHPHPGRRLPRPLRARHVHRRAEALAAGLADPGFQDLLAAIDGGPLQPGNRATPYFTGDAAFAAVLQEVAAARREILIESYIFKDDATGRRLGEELAAAARRGVAVRVLVDALGSVETSDAFWRGMGAAGVTVCRFHPLRSRLWLQFFRDHRKILVADRRTAFTGGMNVADEYGASRPSSGAGWRDSHVRVQGPVAREMAAVFAEGWGRAGGEPLPPRLPGGGEPQPAAGDGRVLVLESRPGRGHRESAAVLAAIVAAARRTVWITNAYFAPGRVALDVLERAASRGVDVRLLLPGVTDVPVVRHAGHGSFARLLAAGVRIWEYGPSVLHAKTLVADGAVSVIGSSNLDFRSFRFNAECNVVLLDPAVALALEAAFRGDLARSVEIEPDIWRRRPVLHRLGDRLARWLSPVL